MPELAAKKRIFANAMSAAAGFYSVRLTAREPAADAPRIDLAKAAACAVVKCSLDVQQTGQNTRGGMTTILSRSKAEISILLLIIVNCR